MSRVLPILFNTDMVRAILGERKTVTRRVINPQQFIGLLPDKCKNGTPEEFPKEKKYMFKPYCDMTDAELIKTSYKPPYQPGDILYARETWCWCPCWDCGMDTEDGCCDKNAERFYHPEKKEYGCYGYKASFDKNEEPFDKWRPSIHMPKEAARIWLKVKDVRVDRLQDITAEDVIKEGVQPYIHLDGSSDERGTRTEFIGIWDSTIKKSDLDRYGWDANPWVWVIEFERCKEPD